MKSQQYNKSKFGFSLIEMAVVIAIMGILMTFGIRLATSFQNKGAFSATAERQKQLKDILTAFLAREGRLPCPADPVAMTGIEDPVGGGVCANNPGLIPFQTLGIPKSSAMDGWDRYFTYVVWDNSDTSQCGVVDNFPEVINHENWTVNVSHLISPFKTYHDGTNGCLMIEEADASGNPQNWRRAVALVISHGPNGFGGYTAKGKIKFPDVTIENNNSIDSGSITTAFRTQPINLDGFDDIVLEISADDLLVPLKRDGTVVSKQQLDRDYLYTLFAVTLDSAPDCTLSFVAPAKLDPDTAPSADAVTLILDGPYNASITIPASKYCPGGQFVGF